MYELLDIGIGINKIIMIWKWLYENKSDLGNIWAGELSNQMQTT